MLALTVQQEAAAAFFVPLIVAYGLAFAVAVLSFRRWPRLLEPESPRPPRPWSELGVALAVVAAILGIGQLFHRGWLLPAAPGDWHYLTYTLNQLLVWSPLFLAMAWRRQLLSTAWWPRSHLLARLAIGVGAGVLAVGAFVLLRGEDSFLAILRRSLSLHAWAHAVPVVLEGVGIAFLFVRLQWTLGPAAAPLVPAVLFALAHVPRSLQEGESAASIAVFFAFNTVFVAVLLLVMARLRCVLWLGVAHYLMDVATSAF